jgi:hypothetical protein
LSKIGGGETRAEGEGEVILIMKLFLLTTALIISTSVYAQDASKPPTASGKSTARMKPKAPVGCTLVGTVRGTKLWAGDCTAPDQLRSSVPAAESSELALPDQAAGAIPPGQK